MAIPMPNERLNGRTVVASVVYNADGDEYTVLLLNDRAPYFTVQILRESTVATWDVLYTKNHYNIVPAVRDYEDSGGSY